MARILSLNFKRLPELAGR